MQTYMRFILIIVVSTTVMWALMYLNVHVAEHVLRSETRLYTALIMGAAMLLVMTALLASERARLSDPRVQALARQIVESQQREIDEMRRLVEELERRRDAR